MNLDMLKRQHEEIFSVLLEIKDIVRQGNLERDAADIAKQISILAGKLKIHLASEDKYMYPSLLNDGNPELKKMAEKFIKEMGDISDVFTEFKDRYNTKTKILNNRDGFLKEIENIFKTLENRIEKENKVLYPLIKS
ncbi:MAG TPA: hemerythrin domain-containing protein [Clostridiales bacterium]|nr:hemerythrin domain-containing protein [Clostridiales bacterium]